MQKTDRYLKIPAHAKINLSLDIVGKRSDGYHLVRMIMQMLQLHDDIEIRETEGAGVQLETDFPELPVDRSNLIVRAAERILRQYAPGKGVFIRLVKRIPLAAGLAGGSTDAAAVLRGLNELLSLKLGMDDLCRIGMELGADVPFCVLGGTALSEGIGEILTPAAPIPECTIVLVKPRIPVSTADIYHRFDQLTEVIHPDVDGQREALQNGDLNGVVRCMRNVLEPVTAGMYPEIGLIREKLMQMGACGARMSGSGPTVFGLFREKEAGETAVRKLQEEEPELEIILTAPMEKENRKTDINMR